MSTLAVRSSNLQESLVEAPAPAELARPACGAAVAETDHAEHRGDDGQNLIALKAIVLSPSPLTERAR